MWIEETSMLSKIAKTESRAVYNCYVSGYKNKITYFMRMMLQSCKSLQKLNQVILTEFIPAISNEMTWVEVDQQLLSLPTKLEGLGFLIFVHFCIFVLFSYLFFKFNIDHKQSPINYYIASNKIWYNNS